MTDYPVLFSSCAVIVKDFTAATVLLEPLATQQPSSRKLRSALGRAYLYAGQVDQAEHHFAAELSDRARKKIYALMPSPEPSLQGMLMKRKKEPPSISTINLQAEISLEVTTGRSLYLFRSCKLVR